MTIKDVEKQTGLTSKSIRFYESKGLISVKRNKENSYRSYSTADITRLKQIKLFRYLDFSIEEIRELLDSDENIVRDELYKKSEEFSERMQIHEEKQEICLTLAKDYNSNQNLIEVIEEYDNVISFMESDKMTKLKDLGCPNLPATVAVSLSCLGPILWLFINIFEGKKDILMVNAVFALIGAGILTANWIHYIREYQRYKCRVQKKNRQSYRVTLIILGCYILGIIALCAALRLASDLIGEPENYLFSEFHLVNHTIILPLLLVIPALMIYSLTSMFKNFLLKKTQIQTQESSYEFSDKKIEEENDVIYLWNRLGKWRLLLVGLWVILVYCSVTWKTAVTPDHIVCYSPLHPQGTAYSYQDVEKIDTGFGNKIFTFTNYNRKGNFFYRIYLDGRKITFHAPSTNEDIARYNDDTYLELEEFDRTLMKPGIQKNASAAGHENCDFDARYVERFLRIIENR